jgi:hypothetical protein
MIVKVLTDCNRKYRMRGIVRPYDRPSLVCY